MAVDIYEVYRRELEKQYIGSATLIERQSITDPNTHITSQEEVEVWADKPCKVSYKAIKATDSTDAAESIGQIIKLFIAPDVTIQPGSKIVVTQNGATEAYQKSGKPAIYQTHQEIILKVFESWA